jgi:lysophospholipase L1-like esterase
MIQRAARLALLAFLVLLPTAARADHAAVVRFGLADIGARKVQPLEDARGALGAFYESLARTAAKQPGARTRISHFGDSLIEMDLISGPARKILQQRFGDAGHGFVRVSWTKPWYKHQDVFFRLTPEWINTENWKTLSPDLSNLFGIGGPVSTAYKAGATATYGTVKGFPGDRVSRFEVLLLGTPEGGRVQVAADGKAVGTIDTRAPKAGSAWAAIDVPDGPHTFAVKALDRGARLFGVVLERDAPGVVYDALGINGIGMPVFLKIDRREWLVQAAHRAPALIVLGFGINEAGNDELDLADYGRKVAQVIQALHQAAPRASILLIGPLDRATKQGTQLVSMPLVRPIVDAQRKAAAENHAAFWCIHEAMGGEGSMAKWYQARPRLGSGDLMHVTPEGSQLLAEQFTTALLQGFARWLEGHGVPKPAAPPVSALPRVPVK